MSWQVEWTQRALREAERLDPATRVRIIRAIERLAETDQGDVKQLRGSPHEWRLRVGDWRVRFLFDRTTDTITILRVLPRGRAYRD